MKRISIFMISAVMLLMSARAFAQTTVDLLQYGKATISEPIVLDQTNVPWAGYWPDGKFCFLPETDGSGWVCYWGEGDTFRTKAATTHLEDHIANNNWHLAFGRDVNGIDGFNNDGSWIIGIHRLESGKLVGFFHAESHYPNGLGYKSIGVTYSSDNGLTWVPGKCILATNYPKPQEADRIGGLGDGCVVWFAEKQQYICYFQEDGGCLTMAASSDPEGAAGTWRKWDGEDFTIEGCNQETQLGGNGVAIKGLESAAGSNPSVIWNDYLNCWVMVYSKWGGDTYLSFSKDGINWESPVLLIDSQGQGYPSYPNLVSDQGDVIGGKSLRLYYAKNYNEWGVRELAYRTISFTPIAEGTYYLRNVATGKFWGSANEYGTQGSLVDEHQYVILKHQSNDNYIMETMVSDGDDRFYFNGEYMDQQPPAVLTVSKVGDYYTFAMGNAYIGYDGTSTVLGKNLSADDPNALWQVMTEKEMKAEQNAIMSAATLDKPADVSFLIKDAGFGRNRRDTYVVWQVENCQVGVDACAASWYSPFSLSQTIANAPKGVYRLDAQGFYRQDGSDDINLPYFYLNDQKSTFPVQTGSEEGLQEASESFDKGFYASEPIFVELKDTGTLIVGAKLEQTGRWCVWDNFRLTYYGSDAKLSDLNQIKGDANGDGKVNAADIVMIVNYITGNPLDQINMTLADATGDGVVNADDIVTIVKIIMGN